MVEESLSTHASESPSDPAITWPGYRSVAAPGARHPSGLTAFRLPIPSSSKVDVWAASLDVPTGMLAAFEQTLSSSELGRAGRFLFSEHRDRYIVAHGWLRQLLSGYVSVPAAAIEFDFGFYGKPALAGLCNPANVQFNLAHSENLALVAVACGTPVGIDVERRRILEDADDLVQRFFSPGENSEFKSLAAELKPVAFFNLWTRKEAWLKATGEGIAHLLNSVEVSFLPGNAPQLLNLPKGYPPGGDWTIRDSSPGPAFAGAVVAACPGAEFECRQWDHERIGL
jgi:4'-phosphopantetheinyl transferase